MGENVPLMLNIRPFREGFIFEKRFFELSGIADGGIAFGPEMPAFVIRRLTYFSREEVCETRDSRSPFLVTSHGPTLSCP
jgi:hypothetical protein